VTLQLLASTAATAGPAYTDKSDRVHVGNAMGGQMFRSREQGYNNTDKPRLTMVHGLRRLCRATQRRRCSRITGSPRLPSLAIEVHACISAAPARHPLKLSPPLVERFNAAFSNASTSDSR
jgi:hypothetical protein